MKLPVVVLTGFLGAGKTSLLNRVLAARAAAGGAAGKLAIVVNELGTIGVDAELLPGGAARQVELPGGCVCCVLNDALDAAILDILAANPELEMLVIETTGVAEPVPIVWTLERAPLAERLRVAAVVTLVDPTSWAQARRTSVAAEIQVESADVVLMSKTDVTTDAERAEARAAIGALAPLAPVLELDGAAAAAWLLEVLHDPPDRVVREADPTHGDDCEDPDHDHAHDHPHAGVGHAHGVDSVALPIDGTVELEAFEDAIANLPPGFFRVKAIVHAIDARTADTSPGWAAVHRVGLRVSSEPIAAPRGSGRVVGLGPGVTAAPLAACVAAAVLPSAGDRDAAR